MNLMVNTGMINLILIQRVMPMRKLILMRIMIGIKTMIPMKIMIGMMTIILMKIMIGTMKRILMIQMKYLHQKSNLMMAIVIMIMNLIPIKMELKLL